MRFSLRSLRVVESILKKQMAGVERKGFETPFDWDVLAKLLIRLIF